MSNQSTTTDFSELLSDLDGGVFAEKIGTALSLVARGVVEHDKQGKVVITLDLKRIGQSSQVAVAHKLAYKAPTLRGSISEENETATPVHVGRGGKITLFPENQGDLFQKDAPKREGAQS